MSDYPDRPDQPGKLDQDQAEEHRGNMILSDRTIAKEIDMGRVLVDPYDPKLLGAASLDIRLSNEFMTALPGATNPVISPNANSVDNDLHFHRVVKKYPKKGTPEPFHLYSGQLVLSPSMERISLPEDIAARIEGRASVARFGMLVCATSAFVSPGFKGHLTLELYNLTNRPIELVPGMSIAQLVFYRLDEPCENPYCGSKEEAMRELKRLGLA